MEHGCPICKSEKYQNNGMANSSYTSIQYSCQICGRYIITHPVWSMLHSLDDQDQNRLKISAFTRERYLRNLPVLLLTSGPSYDQIPNTNSISIDQILKEFPRRLNERIDRGLINLSKMSNILGAPIRIEPEDYPLFYPNTNELFGFEFMIKQLKDLNLLSGTGSIPSTYSITSEGWNRIYELESLMPDSMQGFIAMSFHQSLNSLWQNGIARAIRDAGFNPHRVSESETNGKICDEIIVQIRKSKFIVADFTGQRNGVYFEAGYALGLGIPVIWTCKKEEVDSDMLHFDTRQYNHISWETEEDMYKRLLNRIKANIV